MEEITFQISECPENGWLVASWDAPHGEGGITTQARNLRDLEENIREAVDVHFDEGSAPKRIRIHFATDLVFAQT